MLKSPFSKIHQFLDKLITFSELVLFYSPHPFMSNKMFSLYMLRLLHFLFWNSSLFNFHHSLKHIDNLHLMTTIGTGNLITNQQGHSVKHNMIITCDFTASISIDSACQKPAVKYINGDYMIAECWDGYNHWQLWNVWISITWLR